jgi:hypothetical protein
VASASPCRRTARRARAQRGPRPALRRAIVPERLLRARPSRDDGPARTPGVPRPRAMLCARPRVSPEVSATTGRSLSVTMTYRRPWPYCFGFGTARSTAFCPLPGAPSLARRLAGASATPPAAWRADGPARLFLVICFRERDEAKRGSERSEVTLRAGGGGVATVPSERPNRSAPLHW